MSLTRITPSMKSSKSAAFVFETIFSQLLVSDALIVCLPVFMLPTEFKKALYTNKKMCVFFFVLYQVVVYSFSFDMSNVNYRVCNVIITTHFVYTGLHTSVYTLQKRESEKIVKSELLFMNRNSVNKRRISQTYSFFSFPHIKLSDSIVRPR